MLHEDVNPFLRPINPTSDCDSNRSLWEEMLSSFFFLPCIFYHSASPEWPQTSKYPLSLYPVYFLHEPSIGQLLFLMKECWYFRQETCSTHGLLEMDQSTGYGPQEIHRKLKQYFSMSYHAQCVLFHSISNNSIKRW